MNGAERRGKERLELKNERMERCAEQLND